VLSNSFVSKLNEMKEDFVTFLDLKSNRKVVAQLFYPEVSQTIRQHLPEGICHYFMNRTTSGVMEGINNKIKLIKRQGYGFVTLKTFD